MTYTFTEEQLNALIYEVMELASAGVTFECWEAKDRDWDEEIETEEGVKYFQGEDEIKDAWYFYPMEGDPFEIGDLYSIKALNQYEYFIDAGETIRGSLEYIIAVLKQEYNITTTESKLLDSEFLTKM